LHAHIFGLAQKKVTLDQFHALFGADWDGVDQWGWINYIACSKGLKWYARAAAAAPPPAEKLEQCQKSKA
jgi:hypothetical protein